MARNKAPSEAALRKRYTLRYLLAMVLVTASFLLGAFQVNKILEVNRYKGEVVTTAAMQRSLIQQLLLLPDRIQAESNNYSRDGYINLLLSTIESTKNNQIFLTQGRDGLPAPSLASTALENLYKPVTGQLSRTLNRFLSAYEQYAEDPLANYGIIPLQRDIAQDFLLEYLDRALALHTQAAEEQISAAIKIHTLWVVAAVSLILLVIAFVFRPLARDAAKAVAVMSAELDERTSLLSRSLSISKMGHWRASNPQADPIWMSQELLDLQGIDAKEGLHPIAILQSGDVVAEGVDTAENDQHLAFKGTWETGTPSVTRSQWRKANGDLMDMQVHMEAEFDDDGRVIGVVGVIKDITEEAQAQKALYESYEEVERKTKSLLEAQRLGKLASWRCALPMDENLVEWDERGYEMMGCDPETFTPTVENVRRLYSGGERDRLAALSARVLETGEHDSDTFRVQRGDGTMVDLFVRTTLETDQDGSPVALFGTMQDVSKEREAARELEQLAYFDNLTGLANRTLFTRELSRVSEAAQKRDHKAALFLLDLDHFKEVNDTLGHQAGDQLLTVIGQRLTTIVPKGNFVARLGGDEFAVIIEGDVSRSALDRFAKDIIDSIGVPASLSLGAVQTNASIGIALVPDHSGEPDELLRYADLALYASKENGRGRHSYYDDSYSVALGTRMSLAHEIRTALDEDRFEAHFQPIVDLKSGQVSSFEALLRLPALDGGFISPAEFIPVAESSHLIADLGAFVLNSSCQEAQDWVDAGLPPRIVSVNVSAAQVWHGDLEKVVDHALTSSGLDPKLLCIELTESVFAADSLDRLEGILNRLKARGIQLALDDFGTGYSSLGYLNRLPFDRLKIDRTFVQNAHVSAEKRKLLRGIVSLGKGLNLKVTAEGVETDQELRLVRDLGCDHVQGWYFSKAHPADQAAVEASKIDAAQLLVPLDKAKQQRRHQDVVMAALLQPRKAG